MSKLERVREKAITQGINGRIEKSTSAKHKFMITLDDGKVIHFGHSSYEDYLDHGDDKRRARYLARSKKIKDKAGNLTANNKHSPNFYSIHLLW
jgi:hypothetical protein